MVIHAAIVRRPAYAQSWWADIVFFVAIQPGLLLATRAARRTSPPGFGTSARADGLAASEAVCHAVRDSYPLHDPRSVVPKGIGRPRCTMWTCLPGRKPRKL